MKLPGDPIDARAKPTRANRWRLVCGRKVGDQQCNQELGELAAPESPTTVTHPTARLRDSYRNVPTDARARWRVSHGQGLRLDADGDFVPIKERARVQDGEFQGYRMEGSRPVPEALQTEQTRARGGMGIVGEFPAPDDVLVCPQCGQRNRVPRPPLDNAPRHPL